MAWQPDPSEAVPAAAWTPDPADALDYVPPAPVQPVTLPPNEYDIVVKTRKVGYSGLTDDEKAYFDSKIPESKLASGMTLDEIHRKVDNAAQVKAESPSLTALFPTAMTKGAGPWTVTRDIATLPLRTVSGIGAALGEAGGQAFGSGTRPVPEAIPAALQAYMDAMQSPAASVAEAQGNLAARAAADVANDPLTLPLAAVAPGRSFPGIIGKGMGMGAATYGTHVLDRSASGAGIGDALTGETKGQIAQDVAPTLIPLAFRTAGALAAPVAENFGKRGVEHAYQMVRSMVKPPAAARGGQIASGYEEGMRGTIPGLVPGSEAALDAGAAEGLRGAVAGREIFPELVKRDTRNVPEIVENYNRLKAEIDAGFDPALAQLTVSGIRVPRVPILRAVDEGLQQQTAQGKGWPLADRERALEFVKGQLFTHDDPAMVAFADQIARAKAGAGKLPKPAAYQVLDLLPPPAKASTDPAARLAELEALIDGKRLTPAEHAARVAEAAKTGSTVKSIPLYELPSGELRPLNEATRFDPLTPRVAQNIKSNMFEEAFKRSAEQDRAKETAARIAGEQLKRYLTEPAAHTVEGFPKTLVGVAQAARARTSEQPIAGVTSKIENVPSPYDIYSQAPTDEQVAALAAFKHQLAQAQPIYAMQEAMKRADVAKNRYAFSLLRSAAGPVGEFRAWAQENPGMARLAYDFGKRTQGLQQFLTEPRTYTPIPYNPTGSYGDMLLRGTSTKLRNIAGEAAVKLKNATVPSVSRAAVGAAHAAVPYAGALPSFGTLMLRGYMGSEQPLDYPGAY